jgi:hypothetical protein
VNRDEGTDEQEIRAALRDAIDSPALDDVDWEALQRRVMLAVERDALRPWWAVTAHWAGVVVPVSVAASLAGVFTLARSPGAPRNDTEFAILGGALGESQARLEFFESVLPAPYDELLPGETLD